MTSEQVQEILQSKGHLLKWQPSSSSEGFYGRDCESMDFMVYLWPDGRWEFVRAGGHGHLVMGDGLGDLYAKVKADREARIADMRQSDAVVAFAALAKFGRDTPGT